MKHVTNFSPFFLPLPSFFLPFPPPHLAGDDQAARRRRQTMARLPPELWLLVIKSAGEIDDVARQSVTPVDSSEADLSKRPSHTCVRAVAQLDRQRYKLCSPIIWKVGARP